MSKVLISNQFVFFKTTQTYSYVPKPTGVNQPRYQWSEHKFERFLKTVNEKNKKVVPRFQIQNLPMVINYRECSA